MTTPSYQPYEPSSGEPSSSGPAPGPEQAPTPGAEGEAHATAPIAGTVLMAPDQQRLWSTLVHLSPLLLGFVGPLVAFLVLKDRGSFVRRQTAEALNLQILITLVTLGGGLAGGLLTLVTLGLGLIVVVPVAAAFGIAVLVLQIVAAVRANQGVDHHYPLTPRLVR